MCAERAGVFPPFSFFRVNFCTATDQSFVLFRSLPRASVFFFRDGGELPSVTGTEHGARHGARGTPARLTAICPSGRPAFGINLEAGWWSLG